MCGAASSSLIEKKEEELMEEQIYKVHNSKRRTEMKSETSGGMKVREQEVNQAKREGWGGGGSSWEMGKNEIEADKQENSRSKVNVVKVREM